MLLKTTWWANKTIHVFTECCLHLEIYVRFILKVYHETEAEAQLSNLTVVSPQPPPPPSGIYETFVGYY